MPRFFADSNMEEPFYIVTGEDAKHLARSLRVQVGEHLTFSTPSLEDVETEVIEVDRHAVKVQILGRKKNETETKINYHLYGCMTKGDKFEKIIRQTTELGVCEITPVLSKFCVSRPDEKSIKKKIERYQKIAYEAACQSGRGKVPVIHEMISFEKAVKDSSEKNDLSLFYYEDSDASLRDMYIPKEIQKLGIFIGSEGGFSREEAQQAALLGFPMITLGSRILRAETAPVAAISVLNYFFEEM